MTLPPTSLMFRLRLAKALGELDAALREAGDRNWNAEDRHRAGEIAFALAGACRMEGLSDVAMAARSLACLMNLPREQITPIERAYSEKIQELLEFFKKTADRVLSGTG